MSSDLDSRRQESKSATGTIGGVYRDILAWSASLPRWQQELLRRVLRKRDLSPEELSELASAAVAETELQPSPYASLSVTDVPTIAAAEEHVSLVAIKDLRNVNVLRADQNLTFGPHLTVVYGDNAAGKSGYGRVLKKIYRARVVEDILGDVRSETAPAGAATATFIIKTMADDDKSSEDSEERSVEWTDGTPISNIGRFAVLDVACSLTYVRGGTLAVGPAGIDVPHRFAVELDRVKSRVTNLASAAQPTKQALLHLENDTKAGLFIKALSSKTSSEAVTAAAAWTPEYAAELQRLESAIVVAQAQALSVRRGDLQARGRALNSLCQRITTWTAAVSQRHVDALREVLSVITDADIALNAIESLGDTSVSADRLRGPAWSELLSAAIRYVESLGVSGSAEPLSLDGRCVLCWQELDASAKLRVKRFQDHLAGLAQKDRQEAVRRRGEQLASLQLVPDSLPPEDEALLTSVGRLGEKLRDQVVLLATHRDQILSSIRSGYWPARDPIDETTLVAIRELHATTVADLARLPTSDAEAGKQLAELIQRRLELTTRKSLADSVSEVRGFIKNTLEYQRLKAAESGINTRAVSSKASELHARHMTDVYAGLFNAELRELRFRRLKPILAQKTNKAKVEVTPLVSTELKHLPAEKVFSEGERTAIALACFLAELRLGNDSSGLIFDDPVSSLDHNIREHVARRLVTAAKERQVIVFTHDLAFLADLREQARKIQGIDCQFRTLTATEYDAGFVEAEEPFGARSVGKRIRHLRDLLVTVERSAKGGDLPALRGHARDFYDGLRSTWERFIEEVLFAKVVQRLERHVVPGALGNVVYTKELGEQAHEGWRRCSNAIEAHDHAPATGGQSYSVEEMKADLTVLIDACEAAKAVATNASAEVKPLAQRAETP